MIKTTRTLITTVALALLLMFALTTQARAAGPGSITIQNAKAQETYSLYRMFALQSYDATAGAYLYTVTSDWADFITQETIEDIYIEKEWSGYVSWVDGADPADFAKLALEYAETNDISPTASAVFSVDEEGNIAVSPESLDITADMDPSGTYTINFSSLPLGYYLLDSTAGALCSLDTTSPSVTIYEKNAGLPSVEKAVKEDSTNTYADYNTADIGQTIEFQVIITANTGAQNYVLHDAMSSGLTFTGADSVSVQWTDDTGTEYSEQPAKGTDYTINTDTVDDCTFVLTFAQSFCDQLKNYDQLTVTYTGYLNGNAVIGGEGNPNTVSLTYGDSPEITIDTTRTYTGEVHVYKYTDGDSGECPLAGAQFQLSNKEGEWYQLDEATGHVNWVSNQSKGSVLTSGADGMLVFTGLDTASDYKLVETRAPAGYMPCTATAFNHSIEVDSAGTAVLTQTERSPIRVLNEPGVRLPETGSIGTFPLYCAGTLLLLAGLALLLAPKGSRTH